MDKFAPQLILISAGFDGHYEDDMAYFKLDKTDSYWINCELRKLANKHYTERIVSTLEGDYALSALGRSVVARLKGLMS